MPVVKADRLRRVAAALLRAAGASEEEADAVAIGCVNANLAGHDSHGVIAVPTPPSEGSRGVYYPGEIEGVRGQQRLRDGIEVEDATWDKLRALGREYRLDTVLDLA